MDSEKNEIIESILKSIDSGLKNGIDILILKDRIRGYIDRKMRKKRTKKRKICRPAIFISDSSENDEIK
tara:strand:- start:561 stop:767 length:207 start_codon:yes stop_codon:yes gene_type:complete